MIAKEAWEDARAGAVEAIKANLTDRYVDHDAEEIAWNVLNIIADMWDEQEAAGRAETTTEDVWDLGYRAGLRDASRGTPGESPNPYRDETTTATIEDIADALEHWDRGIDWRLAEQENLTRAAYLRGAEQLMSLLATARTATTEDAVGELLERMSNAVTRLEALRAQNWDASECQRLHGKIEGVKLAASYVEEARDLLATHHDHRDDR